MTALARLIQEDAVGQLLRREGRMRDLGSEDGIPRLDWVDAVPRLLQQPELLETVEREARSIAAGGIRHVIWAGMGGSVQTVRVLRDFGLCGGETGIAVHPLDSTDPGVLNALVRHIAEMEGVQVPEGDTGLGGFLAPVMMAGVAMGMTSEEPLTHLEWFAGLLEQAGLDPAEHLLIMALPDSYLDRFGRERGVPSVPLQPDGGNGTPGRFSAPGTRVFLLPAALQMGGEPGALRRVLERAWVRRDLARIAATPESDLYVRLAADLADSHARTALLTLPAAARPLFPWIEQVVEESLGKGGKGVSLFPAWEGYGLSPMGEWAFPSPPDGPAGFAVDPTPGGGNAVDRLAFLAESFLGWELTVALYGFLRDITFAGQPAVENYKARARALRTLPDPLAAAEGEGVVLHDGPLTLLAPPGTAPSADVAGTIAALLREMRPPPTYLDLTFNGELTEGLDSSLRAATEVARNLQAPLKVRRAPACYHSTEQSEMDGPPGVFSIRILPLQRPAAALGQYDDRFLRAQAAGTWAAMNEAGRTCVLLLIDGDEESVARDLASLMQNIRTAIA